MRRQPPAAVGDERRKDSHHEGEQRRRETIAREGEPCRPNHDDHLSFISSWFVASELRSEERKSN
jgi:hypothetical protein